MKHAYLIIAHNEFPILEALLRCLDDSRNTVFLHFDSKVKIIPALKMAKSQLYILENRVDVRWGDVSQIKCELTLLETAIKHGPFDRYTLLSGVHMPLKNQDEIMAFLTENSNLDLLSPVPNSKIQEELKMHRWNFFLHWYSSSLFAQRLWRFMLLTQDMLGLRRNAQKKYYISSNWFSITHCAAIILLESKNEILKEYKYSFCGDEWFVRTSLERSERKNYIKMTDKLLFCLFDGAASPKIMTEMDYPQMKASGCLFARKFSKTSMDIVNRLAGEFGNI